MVRMKDADGVITNELYLKYEKLLNERCWSFFKTTGIPFEDLKSEANLIFCNSVGKFEPYRGFKFSTFLHWTLTNGLGNYVAKEFRAARFNGKPVCPNLAINLPTQFDALSVDSIIKTLSQEAQAVFDILVSCPQELSDMVVQSSSAPCQIRKGLRKYLDRLGWPKKKIRQTEMELRAAISLL